MRRRLFGSGAAFFVTAFFIGLLSGGCHVTYNFRDATIPANIKTVKVGFIQNKATYINPQLAPKFSDRILQRIVNGTKLTRTNDDNADYVINGTITTYDATQTVGVSSQQASTNRLTVTLHMILKDNKTPLDPKEFDVSRSFDFAASLSLQQAEAQLLDEVVRSLTDDIFNQIFSNW